MDRRLVNIVFDGPPGHEAGRFVEVENENGQSISFGEWIEYQQGYWALTFENPTDRLKALEAENAELRERIKMLERDLTIARECIEMFMVCDPSDSFRVKAEDESDEYHTGTEAIERIDAALAGGKE